MSHNHTSVTLDKVSISRIELLHPRLRAEALELLEAAQLVVEPGTVVRYTHTLRSFSEQDALYAIGRTKPGTKVTNAKGGQSIHNFGLALDFVIIRKGVADWTVNTEWRAIADLFKKAGWTWGGDWKSFKDYPHVEKTFGKSLAQLQALKKAQPKNIYVVF